MATKKAATAEKAIVTDDAPVVEPTKPAEEAKQASELTPDQAMVYAALGLGEQG